MAKSAYLLRYRATPPTVTAMVRFSSSGVDRTTTCAGVHVATGGGTARHRVRASLRHTWHLFSRNRALTLCILDIATRRRPALSFSKLQPPRLALAAVLAASFSKQLPVMDGAGLTLILQQRYDVGRVCHQLPQRQQMPHSGTLDDAPRGFGRQST